jgi:hypothetical protein
MNWREGVAPYTFGPFILGDPSFHAAWPANASAAATRVSADNLIFMSFSFHELIDERAFAISGKLYQK